ncbi:LuxR C-terminal-related transcriptional regulator [Kitasatospora sp. NPDC057904]|uniref:helix-turn-helix transcriptional regulator n=1 Tax=Kitasatospora sp. NPDC057904 TaxID=3346275 RepID=UPI0036DAE285
MSDEIRNGGPLIRGLPARDAVAGGRRILGRARETEALLAVLDGLGSAGGRAIALVGDPGIGKSTLMFAAAAHARAAGVRVAAAQGQYEIAAALPGFRPLLDDNCDVRRQVARGGAAVVVLDDVHQLAADQIPGLERMIHAAATGPLLCLLAYRQRQLSPGELPGVNRLADVNRPDEAHRFDDVHRFDALYRESLGNPQYLRILAADGEAIAEAGTAVLGELAALDDTALAAVQAAAVLGEPFHPELLAAVAGLEPAETMRAVDTLTGLDLLRPAERAPQLVLRHRAVAEVVHQRLEPSRRLTLHRSAAAALAERAAPIARRAHHVARAADPGAPEHVTTLIAAARNALHTSPATSAEYLSAALSLLREGEEHWHEARVLLARTRLLTGDADESRALLDALRPSPAGGPPRGTEDPGAIADASRVERRLGRLTEAGAMARAGLAALAGRDCATAAALHAELADCAYDARDYESCRQHAGTAAAIAHRNHDPVGEAKSLAQASLAHLFTADLPAAERAADSAAELIDATSDATLLTNLEALYQLGTTEGILGRPGAAERHLGRGTALSRRTGQSYIRPTLLMALANVQLRGGNLCSALATLDDATRNAEFDDNPATRAVLTVLRAEALLWLNGAPDLPEVLALADRAAALADGAPTAWAVDVRCLHAELVLLTGDPAGAGRLLLDAAGGHELPRITVWRRPRFCDLLVQSALAEGDLAMAEHWARLAEADVAELPSASGRGFAGRARMRVHAARGRFEEAALTARAAIAGFTAGGERVELCRTLLAVAALALDAGRTDEVGDWLDRATVAARQCGSARLAEEIGHQRGRLAARTGLSGAAQDAGGRDAPDPSAVLAVLTGREREIARLAGTGLTSGEIAGTLVLSVRTVDGHLGRIYRKLGVANRASLTRALLIEAPGAG